MNKNHRKIICIAGLAAMLVGGVSQVQAGKADPQKGYESLYYNIDEKGANIGRCNAIGILAEMICQSTGKLDPFINTSSVSEQCSDLEPPIDVNVYGTSDDCYDACQGGSDC